ncbi:hypothetical protein ATCVCanal1_131L [Acanthocystis turfacea Chlorella virus Canal-1]|nr:hypothetical protein ATCVCanal1_131L [Acanthocystis turfacea Chlorella virus Canal-1]
MWGSIAHVRCIAHIFSGVHICYMCTHFYNVFYEYYITRLYRKRRYTFILTFLIHIEIPCMRVMKTFEHNGFSIAAGDNARENDILTMGGKPGDLWFHAAGVPGSHVMIKNAANVVDTETIKFVAGIAARMSKAPSGVVPVDYTDVVNVEKRKYSKAGEVFLLDFDTILVRK